MNQQRRGFTLTELLVVISILLILTAIILPAISFARRYQRMANTLSLMQQVGAALGFYLEKYSVPGDTASDFQMNAWKYLNTRMVASGNSPYLELPLGRLANGSSPPYTPATSPDTAQHITDYFGSTQPNPLRWEITTDTRVGSSRPYAKRIRIISVAGTPDDMSDDIILEYQSSQGAWNRMSSKEISPALTLPLTPP